MFVATWKISCSEYSMLGLVMTKNKTVLEMLQSIMNRFMLQSTNYMVTPRVIVLFDKTMQNGRYCVVSHAEFDEFQVKDGFTQFVVKLNDKFYGCNYW